MNGARPLLVSDDPELIDEVLRLASAGAVEVHLAGDPEAARSWWTIAPLVLVGADAAPRLAAARLPRRRDVVLVSRNPEPEDWQVAVRLGAEHVACLPDAERWLVDRITDIGEGAPRNGMLVAVIGGCGGAGASTLAITVALAAAARGDRVLVIDADPLGGGLDLLVGLEDQTGVRWRDLADTRGRISTVSLHQNLPQVQGVSVLSWGRDGSTDLPVETMAAVLDAGERAFDLVVVDLPRALDTVTELVLARARETLVATIGHVRSSAAAGRLVASLRPRCTSVRLVLRSESRGIDEDTVARALGLPLAGTVPDAPALPVSADEGEPPSLRDAYGRSVGGLLPVLGLDLPRSA